MNQDKPVSSDKRPDDTGKKRDKPKKGDENTKVPVEDIQATEDQLKKELQRLLDRTHTEQFWNRMEMAIKREKDPEIYLQNIIYGLEDAMIPDKLSPVDQKWVVKSGLSNILSAILDKGDFLPTAKAKANEWLMLCLQFTLKLFDLKFMTPDWLTPHITHVLNWKNCKFYDKPVKETIPSELKKTYIKEMSDSKQVAHLYSNYCVLNVNYFVSIGGFDVLIKAMKEEKNDLMDMRALLRPLWMVRQLMNNSWLSKMAVPLKEVYFPFLLNFAGKNLKREQRFMYNDIMDCLTDILKEIYSEAEVFQSREEFNLEYATRELGSDGVVPRVEGLKMFRKVIEKTQKPEEKKQGLGDASHALVGGAMGLLGKVAYPGGVKPGANPPPPVPEIYLDPLFVLKYLMEHKIVERMIQIIHSHEEIPRQGMTLLIFLAQHNQLTKDHLDLLWEGSHGIHESHKKIIYTSLADLATNLPFEFVNHLLNRMILVSPENYDKPLLDLVLCFTNLALKSDSTSKFAGLDVFWKFIFGVDNKPVESQISDPAINHFAKLLNQPACEQQRQSYLEKCFVSFDHPQTLLLIQKILDTFPVAKKKRSTTIDDLDKKYNLLSTFIDNFVKYKEFAADQLTTKKANCKTKPEEILIGTRHTHFQNIQCRLDFLEYILSQSATLLLDQARIDVLWKLLVENPLLPMESEITLTWLEKVGNPPQQDCYPILAEGINKYLFSKYLQIDSKFITQKSFNVFINMFYSNNESAQKIKKIEVCGQQTYTALSFDLIGFKNMWNIVLDSQSPETSLTALNALMALFSYAEMSTAAKKVLKTREEYITFCIAQLMESIKDKDKENSQRVVRCLVAIKGFIREFDDEGKRRINHEEQQKRLKKQKKEQSNNQPAKKIAEYKCVIKSPTTKLHREGTFSCFTTIGDIKNRCRTVLNYKQTDYLALYLHSSFGDKELKNNNKTLADYNVPETPTLIIKKTEPVDTPNSILMLESLRLAFAGLGLEDHAFNRFSKKITNHFEEQAENKGKSKKLIEFKKGKEKAPAKTATQNPCNQENLPAKHVAVHFDDLYQLLEGDEQIAAEVWTLLQMLPKSERLTDQYHHLVKSSDVSNVNWAKYFDTAHPFKLVYNLEIIESIISANNEESEKWVSGFKALGAVGKLLEILGTLKLSLSSCKRVLVGVLKILSRLLVTPSQTRVLEGSVSEDQLADVSLKLMEFISTTTQYPLPNSEDEAVVEYSVGLLVPVLLYNEKLINTFYNFTGLADWVTDLVLKSPTYKIRKAGEQGLTLLVQNLNSFPELEKSLPGSLSLHIFNQLIPIVQNGNIEAYIETAEHFFSLLQNILSFSNGFDLPSLFKLFETQVLKHPPIEINANTEPDKVIKGLLEVLRVIVRKQPSLKKGSLPLLGVLFLDCLFTVPQITDDMKHVLPKCKNPNTRHSAFKLLVELAKDDETNFQYLLHLLTKQMENISIEKNDFSHWPTNQYREGSYLGLENQGCTCYMNSLLQQLYIIPSFRQGLLEFKDRSGVPKAESLLYQMQFMFATLQESQMRAFNPKNFCLSYKPGGRPINMKQQMDAWEFFNSLMEMLETSTKREGNPDFLHSMFGGNLSHQLVGADASCPHSRSRDEHYYTISVEVRDKADLYSALELFVQSEIVSDVNCDTCNAKVNTLKRCVVKDLPPTLIIHLKRFAFDFDLLVLKKLNHKVAFPFDLDMERFTTEGISKQEGTDLGTKHPPEYYQYELAGIVVHQGSIDSGHYFSYIKERIPLKGEKSNWFEFNDESVTTFSETDIPARTYGGSITTTTYDSNHKETVTTTEITRSAYILVYQRKGSIQQITSTTLVAPTTPRVSKKKRSAVADDAPDVRKNELGNEALRRSRSTGDIRGERQVEKAPRPRKREKSKNPKDKLSRTTDKPVKTSTEKPERQNSKSDKTDKTDSNTDKQTTPIDKPEGIIESVFNPSHYGYNGDIPIDGTIGKEKEPKPELVPFLPFEGTTNLSVSPSVTGTLPSTALLDEFSKALKRITANQERHLRNLASKNPLSKGKVPIPAPILSTIWTKNLESIQDRNVFDIKYLEFVWNIINLLKPGESESLKQKDYDPEFHLIQFATTFMFNIYLHAREKPGQKLWIFRLQEFYSKNPTACRWMIEKLCSNRALLRESLISCYSDTIRRAWADLITTVITTLAPLERDLYKKHLEKWSTAPYIPTKGDSYSACFIDHLLTFIFYESNKNTQIYEPIKGFMKCGREEMEYFLSNGLCKKFGLHLVRKEPEKTNLYSTGIQPISVSASFHMKSVLDIIARCVCSCSTGLPQGVTPPTSVFEELLELPKSDKEFLFVNPKMFFMRVIPIDLNNEAIKLIILHTSWENKEKSEYWCLMVVEAIQFSSGWDTYRLYLDILLRLMEMEDTKEEWRIEHCLVSLFEAVKPYLKVRETMERFTTWLEQIVHTNAKVRKIALKFRAQIAEQLIAMEWPKT